MVIGIFGSARDGQCRAMEQTLRAKGVGVVLVDTADLNRGTDHAYHDGQFFYNGQNLAEVKAWYMRYITSTLPPAFELNQQYHLFADWFVEYMNRRERFGYQLAWLLALTFQGVPVVNPPEHGSVVQLKLFQLAAARQIGLATPKTLITNNPERVRAFAQTCDEVVYKPLLGGANCMPLDQQALDNLTTITAAPVIFQERIHGESVRLTVVGQDVASAVIIPTDTLDYRTNQAYIAGNQIYCPFEPDTDVTGKAAQLMHACGLLFSGLDFIRRPTGEMVFLEANSSPIYLDVEMKTKHPITQMLADYLLTLAMEPEQYGEFVQNSVRPKNFVRYAHPLRPEWDIY